MTQIPEDPARNRRFILSIWQERDNQGRHVAWRFSLQDPRKEVRIGFKNLLELTAFLEEWLKTAAEIDSTGHTPSRKTE